MSLFDDISKFGTIAAKSKPVKIANVVGTFIRVGEAQIEAIGTGKKNRQGADAGLWFKKLSDGSFDVLLKVGVFPLMVKDDKAVKVRVPSADAAMQFILHAITLAEQGKLADEFADVAARKAAAKEESRKRKLAEAAIRIENARRAGAAMAQQPRVEETPMSEASKLSFVEQIRARSNGRA